MTTEVNSKLSLTNGQLTSMMCVMDNGQLVLNPAVEAVKNKRLPLKLQYQLRKIFQQLIEEYRLYEEMRREIIQRYVKVDTEGKIINNSELSHNNDFQKEITALMMLKLEFDINKIDIDFDNWDDAKYDSWTGSEMDLLIPLLTS